MIAHIHWQHTQEHDRRDCKTGYKTKAISPMFFMLVRFLPILGQLGLALLANIQVWFDVCLPGPSLLWLSVLPLRHQVSDLFFSIRWNRALLEVRIESLVNLICLPCVLYPFRTILTHVGLEIWFPRLPLQLKSYGGAASKHQPCFRLGFLVCVQRCRHSVLAPKYEIPPPHLFHLA